MAPVAVCGEGCRPPVDDPTSRRALHLICDGREMLRADARLRVIVPSDGSQALLRRAIDTTKASQWPGPLDIVVVEDSAGEKSLDPDSSGFGSAVTTIATTGNRAAFLNAALQDLAGDHAAPLAGLDAPDVVALLDPAAAVRPDTFRRLAGALDTERRVGAASPSVVLDLPFIEVRIDVDADDSALLIDAVAADGEEIIDRCHGVSGARAIDGVRTRWYCPNGSVLRIPVVSIGAPIVIGVADGEGAIDGTGVEGPATHRITVAARQTHRIVHNAGVGIDGNGRRIYRGQYRRVGEHLGPQLPHWSPIAAVLHADYLRAAGAFDEELANLAATDLALRASEEGWSTVHVSDASVEYRGSLDREPADDVLEHRNRLLTMARHGSGGERAMTFAQAAGAPVALAASALRHPGEGKERLRQAGVRARAFGSAVKGLGASRLARRERGSDSEE